VSTWNLSSAEVHLPSGSKAYHVWAVVLLVGLAVVAGQVGLNLGTNTNAVTNLKTVVSTKDNRARD